MRAEEVEHKIRMLLQTLLDVPSESISPEAHLMNDLGADSWQYLEFRTELERIFGILIPDDEVDRLGSVRECAGLVQERLHVQGRSEEAEHISFQEGSARPWRSGDTYMKEDGTYFMELEVGIPLMGRCNLAETPLLKLVGELRWNHISRFSGVPSKDLSDETGERLYATFYYTEVRFPRKTPMAAFGENDRFTLVNTLQSYGNSIMDGYSFFYPASWPADKKVPLSTGAQAEHLGIPYIRTSNIFVKMLQGASWLKKSRPAQPGVHSIPKVAEIPETYDLIKRAGEEGRFTRPPDRFSQLTPERLRIDYAIDPDRDLNGVGLLYYANYSMILDIAERRLFSEKLPIPVSHDLLDTRTLVSRETAYLSNAHQSDSIEIYVDVWMENPFLSGHPDPENHPIRMMLNYEMFRRSDGRKMLVSTAEKEIFGKTLKDAGMLDTLEKLASPQLA